MTQKVSLRCDNEPAMLPVIRKALGAIVQAFGGTDVDVAAVQIAVWGTMESELDASGRRTAPLQIDIVTEGAGMRVIVTSPGRTPRNLLFPKTPCPIGHQTTRRPVTMGTRRTI